jgi:hypothetical protein
MPRTVNRVSAGETTREELLRRLDQHEEISFDVAPGERSRIVSLRKRGGTYYCDTSVKLYSFDCRDALLARLEELGVPGDGSYTGRRNPR